MSVRRKLVWIAAAVLLAGMGQMLAFGQFGLPGVPGVGALPGAAAVPGAAAPQTLFRFLGFRGGERLRRLRDALVNRRGNFPGLEKKPRIKSLTDPDNMKSDNPAVKEAAAAKADADAAPQKVKAIKYLATVGCPSNGCYPNIKGALLAALDDCTEEVRYEAARAFLKVAGDNCDHCRESCCDKEVTDKLFSIAYDRNDRCCYKEISPRVRKAARQALCACATPGRGGSIPPAPTEGPRGDPDAEPPPGKAEGKVVQRGVGQDVVRSQFVVPDPSAPGVESVAQEVRDSKVNELAGGIRELLEPRIRSSESRSKTRAHSSVEHPLARTARSQAPAGTSPASSESAIQRAAAESSPVASTRVTRPASTASRPAPVAGPQGNASAFYERVQPSGDVPANEVQLAGLEDDDLDADMGGQVRRAFAERFGLPTGSNKGTASASNTSPFQRSAPPSGLATRTPVARPTVQNPPLASTPNLPRPGSARPSNELNPNGAVRQENPPARVASQTPAPSAQPYPNASPTDGAPAAGRQDTPAPWAAGPEAETPPQPIPFEPLAPSPRRIDPNPSVRSVNPFEVRPFEAPPIETYPVAARPGAQVPPTAQPAPVEPNLRIAVPAPAAQKPAWAQDPLPQEPKTSPPVAALSPMPKARLGAARPLVRYGEVRPMVRYGEVKPADESEQAAEEMSEGEQLPDETGLDTAARKRRHGEFTHGTDPWRWAQGRLFARAAASHSVAPVDSDQEAPVELEPLERDPRTADRGGAIFSGQLPGEGIYRR